MRMCSEDISKNRIGNEIELMSRLIALYELLIRNVIELNDRIVRMNTSLQVIKRLAIGFEHKIYLQIQINM
jgi:hypothetical protein